MAGSNIQKCNSSNMLFKNIQSFFKISQTNKITEAYFVFTNESNYVLWCLIISKIIGKSYICVLPHI